MVECLHCGSTDVDVIGVKDLGIFDIHVFKCNACGTRFDEEDLHDESQEDSSPLPYL